MAGKKLLVADDSLTIQKVIRLALSNEGYEIQAVSDGNDAIQQISLFRPDAVLVDVSLPGKTAFEVKRAINEHADLEEVRFVLMSSAFEKVDEVQATEVRFHGRLTKPFDPAHLRQVLSDILGQVDALRMEPTSILQRPTPVDPDADEDDSDPVTAINPPPTPSNAPVQLQAPTRIPILAPAAPSITPSPPAIPTSAPRPVTVTELTATLPITPAERTRFTELSTPTPAAQGFAPDETVPLAPPAPAAPVISTQAPTPPSEFPPEPVFSPTPEMDFTPPPPSDNVAFEEPAIDWGSKDLSKDQPTLPPPSAEDFNNLWDEPELDTSSAPAPAPKANTGFELNEQEADIRHLTESTIKMSGLDDFEWSVSEPSLKPSTQLSDNGDTNFQLEAIHEQTSNIPPFKPDFIPQDLPSPAEFYSERNEDTKRIPRPAPPADGPGTENFGSIPGAPPLPGEASVVGIPDMFRPDQIEDLLRKELQKLLPEIAEKIIKQEIHKMLSAENS